MLGALMPFWYVRFTRPHRHVGGNAGRHHPGTGLVVTAAGLLIVSVIHVGPAARPDQQPEQDVDPEAKPADWREQVDRWNRYHYARVAVIVAAFTLLVTALT